jgi:hypothetical protein
MRARQGLGLLRVIAVAVGFAAMLTAAGPLPAQAATETRSGSLSVTPGWTVRNYDRNPLTLPFTITAPCTTTDYGSGITSTHCDTITVALLHPTSLAEVDSDLVFPNESGAGRGSLNVYGHMLKGLGRHTLRATNMDTGDTVSTTVTLKAVTRTAITSATRTRKAPLAATLRLKATVTVFEGYEFVKPAARYTATLQKKVGAKWVPVRTVYTVAGVASWSLSVKGRADYRVCHNADPVSTASCTGARTL